MADASQLARAIPRIDFVVDVPQRPAEIARRHWNRMVKVALNAALVYHHRQNIPRHFRSGAAQRYGYKARKAGWKRFKLRRFGHDVDLVASGRSKFRIVQNRKIVIGGAAEGGAKKIEGKLQVKFAWSNKIAAQQRKKHSGQPLPSAGLVPFMRNGRRYQRLVQFNRARPKAKVTAEDMKREIQKTTKGERNDLAHIFSGTLKREMSNFRGQRKRVRMPKS